jgi:hypothetical protein
MRELSLAIKKLRPTAEFSYSNDDYSTIKWDVLEGDAPTQTEVDEAMREIKTEEKQAAIKIETDKAALLNKLGITAEEAKLLLA